MTSRAFDSNSRAAKSPNEVWKGVFLGREGELGWLKEAWEKTSKGPQCRVLYAESGYGKSRTVARFYEWLSAEYDPEAYWPESLQEAENQKVLAMPRAKSCQLDKRMPWFWCGLRWPDTYDKAATDDGNRFFHRFKDPEFTTHEEALKARVDKKNRFKKAIFLAAKTAANLGTGGTLEAVKDLLEIYELGAEAMGLRKEDKNAQDRPSTAGEIEERNQTLIIASVLHTFAMLLDKGHKEYRDPVPTILFLDDAHWIDPVSLIILGKLWHLARNKKWPLLIVATHWEKEWIEVSSDFGTNMRKGGADSFATVYADLREEDGEASGDCFKDWNLKGLLPAELEKLLELCLPGLGPGNKERIIGEVRGNALHLRELIHWLQSEDGLECFVDNNPAEDFLADVEDILEDQELDLATLEAKRFRRIDKSLRNLLALASKHGISFLPGFVAAVAQRVAAIAENRNSAELQDLLATSVQPHSIAEFKGEWQMEFRSRNLLRAARRELKKRFFRDCDPDLRKAFADEVAFRLSQDGWETVPQDEQLPFLKLIQKWTGEIAPADRDQRLCFILRALGVISESKDFTELPGWLTLWEHLKGNGVDDLYEQPGWAVRRAGCTFFLIGWHETAYRLFEALLKHPEAKGSTISALFLQAVVMNDLGDIEYKNGNIAVAFNRHTQALKIMERLIEEYGKTSEYLENIALSLAKIGEIENEKNNTVAAHNYCIQALNITQQLVEVYGETPGRMQNTSAYLGLLGELEDRKGDTAAALDCCIRGLKIAERLIEEFDETPGRLQKFFLSLTQIGLLENKKGDTKAALDYYTRGREIAERLIDEYEANPDRLQNITLSLNHIGEIENEKGNISEALSCYTQGLEIAERLIEEYGATPDRLQNVSIYLRNLGYINFLKGETIEALNHYARGLEIVEGLVDDYGETPGRLEDICVYLIKVGNLGSCFGTTAEALDCYTQGLMISERLIEQYGEAACYLQNISASLYGIGNIEKQKGNIADALDCYRRGLEISERVILEYGEDPDRLQSISLFLDQIGNMECQNGNTLVALDYCTRGLKIAQGLVGKYGKTVPRLIYLGTSHKSLAELAEAAGDLAEARNRVSELLAQYKDIAVMNGELPAQLKHENDVYKEWFNSLNEQT